MTKKRSHPPTRSLKERLSPRSLRSQLLVRSLFILAALLMLIGGLQYWLMKDFLYSSRAEALEAQIMSLPGGLLGTKEAIENRPAQTDEESSKFEAGVRKLGRPFLFHETSLALIDQEGNFKDISAEYGMTAPQLQKNVYVQRLQQKETLPMAPNESKYEIAQDNKGNEQLIVIRHARTHSPSETPSLIQMGMDTAPLRDQLLQQLLIFTVLSVLALAGGLLLYIPVLRRTLIPLSRMVEVVQQTDAGNLAERFPEAQGQTEIDRLSASFNGMLERLEHSFDAEKESKERMRQFIADASHELRTPLTSIHGFLEVLMRGAADNPEKLQAALRSMHGESRRINKLVEDLLLLTKLDQAPQMIFQQVRMDALLYEMQPQLHMLAGERTVDMDITADVTALADPDRMKQVILNLFHNAVQHTHPEHGLIRVSLQASEDMITLQIQDNGSGIEPQHLAHIFDRFYRSESSRTRKSGGAGLGLSITQAIIEAHQGTIRATSQPGKGTTLCIELHASQV